MFDALVSYLAQHWFWTSWLVGGFIAAVIIVLEFRNQDRSMPTRTVWYREGGAICMVLIHFIGGVGTLVFVVAPYLYAAIGKAFVGVAEFWFCVNGFHCEPGGRNWSKLLHRALVHFGFRACRKCLP